MNEQSAGAPPIGRSTMLAFERTRVAYERTMMAWIRTATSLITFGFSVYKFFEFEMKGNPSLQTMVVGPRGFGLTLIAGHGRALEGGPHSAPDRRPRPDGDAGRLPKTVSEPCREPFDFKGRGRCGRLRSGT